MGLGSILTMGLDKLVLGVLDRINMPPAERAKVELQMAAYSQEVKKMAFELEKVEIEARAKEAETAGQNIRTEIASNSWMGKNGRPLVGLVLSSIIAANYWISIISQILPYRQVVPLDLPMELWVAWGAWIFGYGGMRTWEKVVEGRLHKGIK